MKNGDKMKAIRQEVMRIVAKRNWEDHDPRWAMMEKANRRNSILYLRFLDPKFHVRWL